MSQKTTVDLAALLVTRERAWEELGICPKFLGNMLPPERARAEAATEAFRSSDAAIVRELRRIGFPVRVGNVELWLTHDGMNFVALDPETRVPPYLVAKEHSKFPRSSLYDYGCRNGRPKAR